MLPFLFTTLKRCLGTEDTKWWKCFRCNFVPFFLQTSLKVGNSTGSSLVHFALQNAPHILYWRQVGTAGRPVKYPYPLPPQPGLCNVCRCGFALSCWNMHGRPWKRCLFEGSILCSKISSYFSALMVPSQKWQVTFAKGTDTTPYHDRPWLLDLFAGNSPGWSFSSSLVRSTRRPFLPKNTWNTDSSDHSTRSTCVMVHPRCLRAQRSRRRFWTLLT